MDAQPPGRRSLALPASRKFNQLVQESVERPRDDGSVWTVQTMVARGARWLRLSNSWEKAQAVTCDIDLRPASPMRRVALCDEAALSVERTRLALAQSAWAVRWSFRDVALRGLYSLASVDQAMSRLRDALLASPDPSAQDLALAEDYRRLALSDLAEPDAAVIQYDNVLGAPSPGFSRPS